MRSRRDEGGVAACKLSRPSAVTAAAKMLAAGAVLYSISPRKYNESKCAGNSMSSEPLRHRHECARDRARVGTHLKHRERGFSQQRTPHLPPRATCSGKCGAFGAHLQPARGGAGSTCSSARRGEARARRVKRKVAVQVRLERIPVRIHADVPPIKKSLSLYLRRGFWCEHLSRGACAEAALKDRYARITTAIVEVRNCP
ncbi:hypothetical protein PHYPSEUDO_014827 [Phytophthora pseudosyringae]|uniref:Uncharacterized protein n=1 Tax=Phytophthora pseudosyringae TaxID=221518 RepID=A0A8T1V752_9STRA|nr:hypothetical protein PHYPSEUDO_014827 [Phytophthora pseudosyringae]